MANSPSFVQHALDLLNAIRPVSARAMFGGHGLYAEGLMFGLLDDDELFLKTDAETKPAFVEAGCKAWVYETREGPHVSDYHQPPAAAIDDPDELRPWLELALAATRRKAAAKKSRAPTAKSVEKPRVKPSKARPAKARGKTAAGKKRTTRKKASKK